MSSGKRTGFFALLACVTALSAQENLSQWSYFDTVTVNTSASGANVPGTVANFPLLVRLTSANSGIFSQAAAGGADIRFTDAAGTTRLKHQIERWDAANQRAEIWVLAPNVSGNGNTSMRMYWGKSGVADSSDGPGVFDTANGFRSVWHMGNATAQNPRPNATVYSTLTATPRNYPVGANIIVQGAIGMADTLFGGPGGPTADASDGNYMMIDSGTATNAYRFSGGRFTATFWANHAALPGNSRHYHMLSGGNNSAAPENALQSIPSNNATNNLYFRYRTGGTYVGSNTGGLVLVTNTWQHIANVVSRGPTVDTLIKYVNGVEYNRLTSATTTLMADTARTFVFFGRAFEQGNDVCLSAALDEMAFASATRSADWIKLTYETQKPGGIAVTVGATQINASAPGAPTGVLATGGNGQATVSWNAPASDGGAAITGYTATSNTGGFTCSTTGGTTCTVPGLANGTAYTFTVTATNPAGTGTASVASNSVTPTLTAGTPGAPTGVSATVGNTQSTVSWTAPSSDGGSAITGYIASSNPDGKTCTATAPAVTCTVTGLNNGTGYSFTVKAINSNGQGISSAPSSSVIPLGPPGAPTNVTGTAGNAQMTVTWTVPSSTGGSVITGYTVTTSQDTTKKCAASAPATTCIVTGLAINTAYTFSVKATNALGSSAASATSPSVSTFGVPGAPTGIAGTASAGQATVTWAAPLSNGGTVILDYTVTTTQDTTKKCTASAPTTTCNVTGLIPGNYTFTVKARNIVGSGAASSISGQVTVGILSFSQASVGMHRVGASVVFRLPENPSGMRIVMHDIWGRKTWSRDISAGTREASWNGTLKQGSRASAGLYLVEIVSLQGNNRAVVISREKILYNP